MRRLEERFWSKVDKGGPDECWLWQAATDGWGYGQIKVARKTRGAHRISYEITKGPIPDGMCVCHHCDNASCMNPNHLFLGTQQDNMSDKVQKGRAATGEHNGRAKLTDYEVRQIRASDKTQRVLGLDFGVDQALIGRIKRRQIWTHI